MQLALSTYQNRGNFYLSSAKSVSDGCSSLELTNHLNNVLSVISDKVIPHASGGSVAYYKADILQAMDYSPFGVKLKGRNLNKTGNTELYRSGFQGQEEDDELKGDGNSVNYTFRMHDPRLGRFFAPDPMETRYPWNSTYAFSENRVVDCIELEGAESRKNIHYYNMVQQKDGSYKPVFNHSHSNLVIRAASTVFRNSITKKETTVPKGEYGSQSETTNVYTYYNPDGTIKRQVVQTKKLTKNGNTVAGTKLKGGPYDGENFEDQKESGQYYAQTTNSYTNEEVATVLVGQTEMMQEIGSTVGSVAEIGGALSTPTVFDIKDFKPTMPPKGTIITIALATFVKLEGDRLENAGKDLQKVINNYMDLHKSNPENMKGIMEVQWGASSPKGGHTGSSSYYDISTGKFLGSHDS
ncbi:MAG: RHS repeat-associated core domain-containing protein [Fluviicola sp.]